MGKLMIFGTLNKVVLEAYPCGTWKAHHTVTVRTARTGYIYLRTS